MPAIKGKDGVLTVEGQAVAQVTAYSLTETSETAETTSFDSTNGFKTHVPTLKSWEGSCDLVYNEQEMTYTDLAPGGDPKALIERHPAQQHRHPARSTDGRSARGQI